MLLGAVAGLAIPQVVANASSDCVSSPVETREYSAPAKGDEGMLDGAPPASNPWTEPAELRALDSDLLLLYFEPSDVGFWLTPIE